MSFSFSQYCKKKEQPKPVIGWAVIISGMKQHPRRILDDIF